jgi:hypothetical protein
MENIIIGSLAAGLIIGEVCIASIFAYLNKCDGYTDEQKATKSSIYSFLLFLTITVPIEIIACFFTASLDDSPYAFWGSISIVAIAVCCIMIGIEVKGCLSNKLFKINIFRRQLKAGSVTMALFFSMAIYVFASANPITDFLFLSESQQEVNEVLKTIRDGNYTCEAVNFDWSIYSYKVNSFTIENDANKISVCEYNYEVPNFISYTGNETEREKLVKAIKNSDLRDSAKRTRVSSDYIAKKQDGYSAFHWANGEWHEKYSLYYLIDTSRLDDCLHIQKEMLNIRNYDERGKEGFSLRNEIITPSYTIKSATLTYEPESILDDVKILKLDIKLSGTGQNEHTELKFTKVGETIVNSPV